MKNTKQIKIIAYMICIVSDFICFVSTKIKSRNILPYMLMINISFEKPGYLKIILWILCTIFLTLSKEIYIEVKPGMFCGKAFSF